jgi:3-hydroxybutyryl-CoA dehydrogenase
MADITKIAVIGAGLMGHGLAQIFALSGRDTALVDLSQELLDTALTNVRANLTLMAEKGIVAETDIEPALSRITTCTDMKEAVQGAGFVIEAVVEKLDVKQKLFKELDAICPPDVILATNTSVISITEIASQSQNRGRIVGTHFWNPPYLIPLVEVIRGEDTDPAVMDATFDLMAEVGKKPVKVMKDVPGFVGNRLQHALWREAISIVENGIADAATVDDVVKNSFGMRLPVLGPLENADLVGLDLTFQIHDYILKHIESSPTPSPLLKEKMDAGELGFKSGAGLQEWSARADEGRARKFEPTPVEGHGGKEITGSR